MANKELSDEEKKEFKQLINYKRALTFLKSLTEDGQRKFKAGCAIGAIDIKGYCKADRDIIKSVSKTELNMIVKYYLINSGEF